ncbi:MAG: thrombospondin type 3 repeat-containing protein [Deltaproteobacteria bacterium]|nr:thrombospondin type 3 repeat-containing protein [Deltaproteobacteria bacterium]
MQPHPVCRVLCLGCAMAWLAHGAPALAAPVTFTSDADFAAGVMLHLGQEVPDQLQLSTDITPLPFVWVAAHGRGTVLRLDAVTGAVLGEYWTAPEGRSRGPRRVAVDQTGDAWVGNASEAGFATVDPPLVPNVGGYGSVVRIGLLENGGCEDRDGDGSIETSTGLGDILPWDNAGNVDNDGGVSTATDECIMRYVRVYGDYVRNVAVGPDNDLWTGGNMGTDNHFTVVDGWSDALLADFDPGCGGFDGLVDAAGVLWSANQAPGAHRLLRYDTKGTLITADDTFSCLVATSPRALAIDASGNVFFTQGSSNHEVEKRSALGVSLWEKATGGEDPVGVVVAASGELWIANSGDDTVTRLDNDGNLLATIPVGDTPIGVAVDHAGKIWVSHYGESTVSRIDPATDTVDHTTPIGDDAVSYSLGDMTGSEVPGAPLRGSWTVVHDAGVAEEWALVTWTVDLMVDGEVRVFLAGSDDGVVFDPEVEAVDGTAPGLDPCRFVRVRVLMVRASSGDAPVLYDLTLSPDTDGDGFADVVDNCPAVANPDQDDLDDDLLGDACDDDDDDDGTPDATDNCPTVANGDQEDLDGDDDGDACDTDIDGDGLDNDDETEVGDPSAPQDTDADGTIDALDTDSDNDGVSDDADNCVLVANPSQDDCDRDLVGDECDTDTDSCDAGGAPGCGCTTSGGQDGGMGWFGICLLLGVFVRRSRVLETS